MIDNSIFSALIQQKADSADVVFGQPLTPEEVVALSLAAQRTQDVNTIVVDRFSQLPVARSSGAAGDVSDGSMYFITEFLTHAIKVGTKWVSLDGKVLRDDTTAAIGLAYAWGYNNQGQLGNGTTTGNKSSPVSVIGGFTDWCQVSGGGGGGTYGSSGIRSNGTLWGWGGAAIVGDGTGTARSSPTLAFGGFTDWCQVSVGGGHVSAVRQNGTLWGWGINTNGRVGNNTTTNWYAPQSVVGGFTDWCQVSAGDRHTAAIRTNGTLWTWGYGYFGRLGDNTIVDKSSPVSVVGGFTDWCQVSAGHRHTAAIRTNGTLWAWGYGSVGTIGDNNTTTRSSPVSVVGGFTDWCQVSAGCRHNAAIRTNGTLWTWGLNLGGQLGNNTNVSTRSPVSVVGGFTNWRQTSAGGNHTTAVRQDGTLWAWGCNNCGQLGDNTTVNRSSPVSTVGGFTDWCQVSASVSHIVGIRAK